MILEYVFDRYEGSKKWCGTRLNLYTYIYLSTRVIVNLGAACGLFRSLDIEFWILFGIRRTIFSDRIFV